MGEHCRGLGADQLEGEEWLQGNRVEKTECKFPWSSLDLTQMRERRKELLLLCHESGILEEPKDHLCSGLLRDSIFIYNLLGE